MAALIDGTTPGPWQRDCWDVIGNGGGTGHVCEVSKPSGDDDRYWNSGEADANARLIAGAPTMHATILTLCDALDAERAEIERLRAALAPFSEESAYWFSHNYNREDRPVEGFEGYTPVMTCGDLFNARAALAQKGGE